MIGVEILGIEGGISPPHDDGDRRLRVRATYEATGDAGVDWVVLGQIPLPAAGTAAGVATLTDAAGVGDPAWRGFTRVHLVPSGDWQHISGEKT